MSDTKKPGAPNIKDLKAKLGLKTPGGAAPGADVPPPPGLVPPPGVAPPGGDAIAAPPGVDIPAGVRPPPGVTPPPGIAPPPGITPPAVTPPPGMGASGGDLVAPPGFQAPAPAPRSLKDMPVQQVDIDLDVVDTKKSRRIIFIAVSVGACLLTMCGGYYLGDANIKRGWMKKSKQACGTTAAIVKKLDQGTKAFEATLETEIDKTKKGQAPLAYYNPELLSRLSDMADGFDVNNPKLKSILNEQVWTTHYRFVKNAKELLPRLHTFLAICAQLKTSVDIARGFESQYGEILKKKTKQAKEEAAKKPAFGVMIQGDKGGLFFALGDPVNKDGKKTEKADETEGYMLPNGKPGMFSKQPTEPNKCAEVNGSIRFFSPDDAELNNRLKCRGQEDVVFEGWKGQILSIKLILKELEKVNARDLYQQFQRSSGG